MRVKPQGLTFKLNDRHFASKGNNLLNVPYGGKKNGNAEKSIFSYLPGN